jgi:hypothetical protein
MRVTLRLRKARINVSIAGINFTARSGKNECDKMKLKQNKIIINENNIFKKEYFTKTHKTVFDLLGYNENALSKVFTYILSNNRSFYFNFLKRVGLNIRNSLSNYKTVKIEIQKKRREGITDIEIFGQKEDTTKYHVVIECKINKNKVKEQRSKYLDILKDSKDKIKIMVFITSNLETFKLDFLLLENIKIYKLVWLDVFSDIYDSKFKKNKLIIDVKKYIEGGYNMNNYIKEILVQDLGVAIEIKRFLEYNIYRRPESAGNPLYFAPYFTKGNHVFEGIKFVSKILGVLTITANSNKDDIINDLNVFLKFSELESNSKTKLIEKWVLGIKLSLNEDDKSKDQTYYFLDDPITLPGICKKKNIKKSKGWIGGAIPKNRCVTFKALIENMNVSLK